MKKDYNRYCHSLLRIEEVPFLLVFVCRPSVLSNIAGTNGCYLYQGRDVKEDKDRSLIGQILVIAPHAKVLYLLKHG